MSVSPNRVTSADVALRAGVSRTTVSFVLNNTQDARISAETRQRVLQAAEELGYVPNALARSLVTGKSRTLVYYIRHHRLLSVDFYVTKLLEAVSLAVNERGYRLRIESQDLTEPDQILEMTRSGEIDGLLILGIQHADDVAEQLSRRGFPLISMRSPADDARWSRPNGHVGFRKLARHFLDRGYDDIGYIHYSPEPDQSMPPRAWDLAQALTTEHPAAQLRVLTPAAFSPESGFDAMRHILLSDTPLPRVIAAGNDTVAIGIMAALTDAGLRIPADVAVSGYDDTPAARFIRPALTTLRQDLDRLARTCVAMLLAQLDGEPAIDSPAPFDHALIIRQST